MTGGYDPINSATKCADEQVDVDWTKIEECSNSQEGDELHAKAGEKTHALVPKVDFIPTVILEGSESGQEKILKNLLLEVCKTYQGNTGNKGPQKCVDIL